jgi:competence protein ComEC
MPHHVVVSAGYRNRYGHPHAAVMARFQKHGAGAVRTDLLGSLDIRFERQLTVTGYRLSRPRYWRP